MSRPIRVKNNKASSDVWVGKTIEVGEYFEIPESQIGRWRENTKVFTDVANGNLIVNNLDYDFSDVIQGWKYLDGSMNGVETVAELCITWSQLKAFHTSNLGCFLNYIELDGYYYIWLCYRAQKFYIPRLEKETSDCDDFETNYKAMCNIPQAIDTRLSTCRYGRKLYSKYITLHTSTAAGYNNDNYLGVDAGDVTYTMLDADGNVTTNESLCVQTLLDFEGLYSMEIAGGDTSVPSTLPGDQDAWALYVIGAPDYPKQYGGSIEFISNPRLKWDIGKRIIEDESLNPANIDYVAGYHFTKIRWLIKHPAGAQAEFQIHMRIYKAPTD